MLDAKLKYLKSREEIDELLKTNAKVMICCGRLGPMCIPVYAIMEKLEKKYPRIKMAGMDFDISAADYIKNLPECKYFMGLPFTVYFKNGGVVKATTSIQNEKQITDILNEVFKD
ncbi:thioredoxin family protein [bacterium]|nr:thioredoxin family protein [bacterium]